MARSIWSGSVAFGLVNIPVKLYTAVRDHSIHLNMLSPDGTCRLRRKLYCPDTGEEYDFSQTARGFEVAPGQYVIINEDELEQIKPESGRTIDISDFVDHADIDARFFDRPYYLVPDERGVKGYQLLLQVMNDKGKVGIAKFAMRQKEYLAALRPLENLIVVEVMRYADELIDIEEELDLPEQVDVQAKERKVAEQLVEALSAEFDPTQYKDEYRDRLAELIERKAEGEEILTHEAPEAEEARVINIMDALEKSLEQAKSERGKAGGGRRRKKSA